MRERFTAAWAPRVGPRAAEIMWRRARWRASGLPFVLVVVLVAATTSAGVYYTVIGILTAVLVGGASVNFVQTRQPLADALSEHLSLPITTKNMPPLNNAKMFDKFIANMRAGRPGNSNSRTMLGGFIRIERP